MDEKWIPDEDTYTFTLTTAVKAASGTAISGPRTFTTSALEGDANNDKEVDIGDLLRVRTYLGPNVNADNARYDVTGNGVIDSGDLVRTREKMNHLAP